MSWEHQQLLYSRKEPASGTGCSLLFYFKPQQQQPLRVGLWVKNTQGRHPPSAFCSKPTLLWALLPTESTYLLLPQGSFSSRGACSVQTPGRLAQKCWTLQTLRGVQQASPSFQFSQPKIQQPGSTATATHHGGTRHMRWLQRTLQSPVPQTPLEQLLWFGDNSSEAGEAAPG